MDTDADPSSAPILVAHLDLECGVALVAKDDWDWMAAQPGVVATPGAPWEITLKGVRRGFDAIPVARSVVTGATPKLGSRRYYRQAQCGGGAVAQQIDCFPLSSGRYAKVELAGYSVCVRGDGACEETYVKIGDITIAWDARCRLIAQVHPQFRWVCLP
jgi:hypothetical protein